MEYADIKPLVEASARLLSRVPMEQKRYLYPQIDWNDRLVCIKGPKGTGKTTLIQQHMRETFGIASDKAIYISADHIWFSRHDILEAIDYFNSHGFTHVFIDEVHHAENWSRLVKTISDFYPDLFVVYSGSSILKLSKGCADLSRRQAVYCLKGLSFREYLSFEGIMTISPIAFEDLLRNHRKIAGEIVSRAKILPLFEKYLREGYYPMYAGISSQFKDRIVEIVNNVLDVDFSIIEDFTPATIRKAKKMLMVLAESCPQRPNMSMLYRELETNRNLGLKMLDALERSELVMAIAPAKTKLKRLSKPEKLLLGDTNLMNALVSSPDIGTARETFFASQVRSGGHEVVAPEKGDFLVDGKYLFEIGGAGKGFDQIRDLPDSFVVNDNTEVGFGNKIPLWLFGFLY